MPAHHGCSGVDGVARAVDGLGVGHGGAEGRGRLQLLLHDHVLVFLQGPAFLGSTVLEPDFDLKLKYIISIRFSSIFFENLYQKPTVTRNYNLQ